MSFIWFLLIEITIATSMNVGKVCGMSTYSVLQCYVKSCWCINRTQSFETNLCITMANDMLKNTVSRHL